MDARSSETAVVNGVVADFAGNTLHDRSGRVVNLRPQAFSVLRHLAKNANRLVTKDELMEAVWPGIAVTDDSLVQCVHEIRRALNDDNRSVLMTIPRRGYRLNLTSQVAAATTSRIARSTVLSAAIAFAAIVVAGGMWWIQRGATADEMATLAVLPLADLSGVPEQAYFADGMTDDLIANLSKIPRLFVVSRNSTFTFKGTEKNIRRVATDLGVRYVLGGDVRRIGERVRVNIQLSDTKSDSHLWTGRYEGDLAEILDLPKRVTEQVVSALALGSTPDLQHLGRVGTRDVEAHDAYLLGLSFYFQRTAESFAKARTHLEHAVELDPEYAAARVAIAKIYAQVDSIAYSRALAINIEDAGAKARAALAMLPSEPRADTHIVRSWLALSKHQNAEAVAEAKLAVELDPNDVDALEALARSQIYSQDVEAGMELARRAMRQNPAILSRPLILMGLAEFVSGNIKNAASHIERAFEIGSEEFRYSGVLAAAYGLLGETEKARKAFAVFATTFAAKPDLARSMEAFPFSDRLVLSRLAEGLEVAGAKVFYGREDGGYLPLAESDRLSGDEIEVLFSGKTVDGKDFWCSAPWQRIGAANGVVEYEGANVQASAPGPALSRVKNNLLCEQSLGASNAPELCSAVYRIPEGNGRRRWGDYVLVTDTGPHPFRLGR